MSRRQGKWASSSQLPGGLTPSPLPAPPHPPTHPHTPPPPPHSAAILSALRSGVHVVMDRYAFSGVAFSAAKPGLDMGWCAAPDAGLPAPDLVLFMDLPPGAAAARGGFGGERYEVPAFQAKVLQAFQQLQGMASACSSTTWLTVDASGSIEEVGARVAAAAEPVLQQAAAGSRQLTLLWDGKPAELE